jgi:4-carboxymuconolactone decarboxylase
MRFNPMLAMVAITGAFAAGGVLQRAHAQESKTATADALPKDVYPDSRSRLPLVKRESLDADGQKAYDEAAGDKRSLVGLQGPGGIRLHSPKLALAARPANQYLRFGTQLPRRLSELAILVTAREMSQQFEWAAHEPEARKVGLEQNIIDVVKYRKPLTGLGDKETVIIDFGRQLFQKHAVASDTFARARKLFGDETLVDLVSLMGNYAQTSVLLNAFDQHLLAGQKPLLPEDNGQ